MRDPVNRRQRRKQEKLERAKAELSAKASGSVRAGRLEEAVAAYRRIVRLDPGDAAAHADLGAALRRSGDLAGAEAACRKAVALDPGHAEARNNLGVVLQARGESAAALTAFGQAAGLGYPPAHANLGGALFVLDRIEESEAAYRRAIDLDGGFAGAHDGLGVVLLAAGRLDDATVCFRRATGLDPGLAEAWYNLACAEGGGLTDGEAATVKGLLADSGLAPSRRIALHFALGEYDDAGGRAEQAFAHFKAGNGLRRAELADHGHVFDAEAHQRTIERTIEAYGAGCFEKSAGSGDDSELPVFVLGMPRSGTTLVEQIAASHPAVHGAGELNRVAALEDTAKAANGFVEHLRTRAPGALRVIDKTPFNFLHLGKIATLFPRARIVHCRRQARDLCLSCYFQNFVAPYPWSTDLADLARYLGACERLMEHWRAVLPVAFHEVRYEDLVADQERESRRLIEALGLPWDDACLRFHDTRRTVRTASNWQVRRPLYATSVGRWRAYEKWLGACIENQP